MVLRNTVYRSHGDVEVFQWYWKQIRIKAGKWSKWNNKHIGKNYSLKDKHRFHTSTVFNGIPKITYTGKKMEVKKSWFRQFIDWFKGLWRKV
jgi:hypothetical protein